MISQVSPQVGLRWLLEPWLGEGHDKGLKEIPQAWVNGVCADSRDVGPGDLYAAVAGSRAHGLDFVEQAVSRGAAAVVWEPTAKGSVDVPTRLAAQHDIPVIPLADLGRRLGAVAARCYGDPSRSLELVGVTGTDGKTSVTHFIAQLLSEPHAPWGVVGTMGYGPLGRQQEARLTTPDGARLQQAFAECRVAGCSGVALEASSHALEQGRLASANVDVAVLTHLGRDHLDYHGSMEAYADAKRRLFELNSLRAQVLNLDDELGRRLQERAGGAVFTYSLSDPAADLYVESVTVHPDGLKLGIRAGKNLYPASLPLLGRFNVANALAAAGAALALGRPLDEIVGRLSTLEPVAGRMERFCRPGKPLVVVDYAHTPGALQHSLQALREHCRGNLTVVFGCGGERDTGKRPLMGSVAACYADSLLITDDNPRNEPAQSIHQDILQGVNQSASGVSAGVEPDRAQAIERAIREAGADDAVLIAGKGHESTQQVGAEYIPFSDRQVVLQLLDNSGVR